MPNPLLKPFIRFFAEWETGLDLDLVRPVDDIGRIAPRPVLIIQGMGDKMIPPDSAQRLYEAAGEERQLWIEPDIPHLSMFASYPARYSEIVIKFFDIHLLNGSSPDQH